MSGDDDRYYAPPVGETGGERLDALISEIEDFARANLARDERRELLDLAARLRSVAPPTDIASKLAAMAADDMSHAWVQLDAIADFLGIGDAPPLEEIKRRFAEYEERLSASVAPAAEPSQIVAAVNALKPLQVRAKDHDYEEGWDDALGAVVGVLTGTVASQPVAVAGTERERQITIVAERLERYRFWGAGSAVTRMTAADIVAALAAPAPAPVPAPSLVDCGVCNGTGLVPDSYYPMQRTQCIACDGGGLIERAAAPEDT